MVRDASGRWSINPAAIGANFCIHRPLVNRSGLDDASDKGIADQSANVNKTISGNGTWFDFTIGPVADPIAAQRAVADVGRHARNFLHHAPNSNEHDDEPLASRLIDGNGENGSLGWRNGHSGAVVVRLTD